MKIGHLIDGSGFLTEDVLAGSGIDPDVTVLCPDGFYKPKWNRTAWVEGLTQAEVDAIVNTPTLKTPDQLRIEQLETQLAAQNENNAAFMSFVIETLGV